MAEIGDALADQTDCEHRWLINPQTGEIAFWTADTGVFRVASRSSTVRRSGSRAWTVTRRLDHLALSAPSRA